MNSCAKYLCDNHCHLQFPETLNTLNGLFNASSNSKYNIKYFNVCATSPADWDIVLQLNRQYSDRIIASIGVHPWYTNNICANWKQKLLDMSESADWINSYRNNI